ncbi:hypothetical protein PIB30_042579 [Stylosanthes scabra]|uniref:Uncharacterized protein n=1 Tax=Stylosanthes scabra TaxID=79078 RepID=A0ABU6RFD9_9FABA|nr:hypothetical protein [Stylosanthes scabra]
MEVVQERERTLELQLHEYCGIREQETTAAVTAVTARDGNGRSGGWCIASKRTKHSSIKLEQIIMVGANLILQQLVVVCGSASLQNIHYNVGAAAGTWLCNLAHCSCPCVPSCLSLLYHLESQPFIYALAPSSHLPPLD